MYICQYKRNLDSMVKNHWIYAMSYIKNCNILPLLPKKILPVLKDMINNWKIIVWENNIYTVYYLQIIIIQKNKTWMSDKHIEEMYIKITMKYP